MSTRNPRPVAKIQVRQSAVHGRGAFASVDLLAGETIGVFGGELIDDAEAERRARRRRSGHTWMFDVGDGRLIDGGRGGNETRFLNHSCEPNCAAETDGTAVTFVAITDIPAGAELLLDYHLTIGEDAGPAERALFNCQCGARTCRGTMLGQ